MYCMSWVEAAKDINRSKRAQTTKHGYIGRSLVVPRRSARSLSARRMEPRLPSLR
jgi:hypothetical protein